MKVSYRKQIARQHSCHKSFGQGTAGGVVDHVNYFPSYLAIFGCCFHTVCAHVGGPKIGDTRAHSFGKGCG